MSEKITTETDISASAPTVWNILTDFAAYPEWNPFIKSIAGDLAEGSRLTVRLEPPGGRGISMTPKLVSVIPQEELKWLGHLLIPGIFDGEHRFSIRSAGNGSIRFTQEESFTGMMVPLTRSILAKTRKGFVQMNEALKRRAESI
jgi:hypothetical protein